MKLNRTALLMLINLVAFPSHGLISSAEPVAPMPPSTPPTAQAPVVPLGSPPSEGTPVAMPTTPEQAQALLKQAKELSPEQLQAISSGYAQMNPADVVPNVPPAVAPTPATAPIPEPYVDLEQKKNDEAFNMLVDDVLPLSPDQITRLHKYYDLTLQAKAAPANPPPNPQFTSTIVNLEPGSTAPVVRLAAGFITSLIFVDATGAPFPLTAYSLGDPQNFNIQWDQKSNTLFVQSLKQYAHGNLAVQLWGLNTPVMITLVSGQRNVDFRVDFQVGARGPDAVAPVVDTTFDAKVNPVLINLLDGVPPIGSVKLGVAGGPGDAWYTDNRMYFRTKLTVLSPAWTGTASSPDGTHVYEMMPTPRILASQNGKAIDIKLSGL